MYGLCDCNNFYASCERVFRPDLVGRPVVVLSNNDGCIIARSNEAKALGIGMGQPFYQVRPLIERGQVAVFSANFALYGDMSRRVMATLRALVPGIEVYSIDEAFFDLRGVDGPFDELGRSIGRTIRRNTGIPVSIGIAPTKTLAKIASKLAKQYPRLEGCCYMHRAEDIDKVLGCFPLRDVWGIGRRYGRMFDRMGLVTARQFVELPQEWVRARMGITGLRTWNELRGVECISFEQMPQRKQQITVSRSFPREIYTLEELERIVAEFASMCAEKLRAEHSVCREVQCYLLTNRHREEQPQRCVTGLSLIPDRQLARAGAAGPHRPAADFPAGVRIQKGRRAARADYAGFRTSGFSLHTGRARETRTADEGPRCGQQELRQGEARRCGTGHRALPHEPRAPLAPLYDRLEGAACGQGDKVTEGFIPTVPRCMAACRVLRHDSARRGAEAERQHGTGRPLRRAVRVSCVRPRRCVPSRRRLRGSCR